MFNYISRHISIKTNRFPLKLINNVLTIVICSILYYHYILNMAKSIIPCVNTSNNIIINVGGIDEGIQY